MTDGHHTMGGLVWTASESVTRKAELTESRRAISHNVEVVTLTATPMGSFVCGYLEGSDPVDGNRRFAASSQPYDVWFKDGLKKLFPPESTSISHYRRSSRSSTT